VSEELVPAAGDVETVDDLELAAGFPTATREQWQKLVARVVAGASADELGADPERLLATHLSGGIDIEPLYTADDLDGDAGFPGQAPFVRGRTAAGQRSGWDVRQRHSHPDPIQAREQIMEDLDGGVSSLWLRVGDGGIPIGSLADVLAEVYLDLAPIVLDAGEQGVAAATEFLAIAGRRNVAADQLHGGLGLDPLGLTARTGTEADLAETVALAARCVADWPNVRAITVDALVFHEAGGSDVDELGFSIAAGIEYLRALQAAGLSADAAFDQLEFRLAATADQFSTIAKLRAARRVWAQVAASCGVTSAAAGQRQHAVSSWSMLTRRDPWNNILRGTLAGFAAGVGGADAVTIAPFDAALGLSDTLARRVARNTQALLVEESHVARVIDPAGGSWYVESLTEELAAAAWSLVQDIERGGGLLAALRSGEVAERLATSRQARLDALAHRQDAITGVSEFPNLDETLLDRPASPSAEPAGLPRIRWSQWHEELRDRADTFAQQTGHRPTVTLVPVGAARGSAAACDQARTLLAPAGIATVLADVASAADSPRVECVCCAPDVEPEAVTEAITALRAAGATRVIVAGLPEGDIAADRAITDGMDVLEFQRGVLDDLGVAE
jgi:methylmalonyl-CoA mutase